MRASLNDSVIDFYIPAIIRPCVSSRPLGKSNPARPHIPISSDEQFRWVVCESIERVEKINYYLKVVCNHELYTKRLRDGAKLLLETLVRDLASFARSKPFGLHPIEIEFVCVKHGIAVDQVLSLKSFLKALSGATENLPILIRSVIVKIGESDSGKDSSSSSSSVVVDPLLPGAK